MVLGVNWSESSPITGAFRSRAMPAITRALGTVYPVRRGTVSDLESFILTQTAAAWDAALVDESRRLRDQLDEDLQDAIRTGNDDLARLLRMSTLAPDTRLRIARSLDDTRRWVDPNGYQLSDRIWNARNAVRKAIDQEIRLAIVRGSDPRKLAQSLRQYLTPPLQGGRAIPGSPAGRGAYAARRLARTELTRARAQATVTAASMIPTTRGMKWNLSNRHPAVDDCDRRATENRYGLGAGGYPLDELPRLPDHPHCLCFWTTIFPSRAESDRLLRERYGLQDAGDPAGSGPFALRRLGDGTGGGGGGNEVLESLANQSVVERAALRASTRRPFGQAVGSHIDFPSDLDRRLLGQAVRTVDQVHGDGRLQRLDLGLGPLDVGTDGIYANLLRRITINPDGLYPRITTFHEIGHLIDARAFEGRTGTGVPPATRNLSLLHDWRTATLQSQRYGFYRSVANEIRARSAIGGATVNELEKLAFINDYLSKPEELWARSYAQYVAIHATDDRIVQEWLRYRTEDAREPLPQQWDDADFEPIALAIDRIFRQTGWRR